MTMLTINLAEILESKLQHGFSVPVSVDVGDLLDYADDDWEETIDLELHLAQRQQAALIFSAHDAKRLRPHLTDEQAWEVAEITRDQTRSMVEEFLAEVADENFPSAKEDLHRRVARLHVILNHRHSGKPEAKRIDEQLYGIERLIEKVPHDVHTNPALEGSITATLDDIELIVDGWSWTPTAPKEG
jgi:hypothetical protein